MKKHSFSNMTLLLLLIFIVITGTSCSLNKNKDNGESTDMDTYENPFELSPNTEILGGISHGFTNVETDEEGKRAYLRYEGGEKIFNYEVTASGTGKDVGFLFFVDGIPQPYRFNSSEAPYEYMHPIKVDEDDKPTPYTFVFAPVIGKQGETLNVHAVSIYNPGFIPDMKKTTSYGGYHTTSELMRPMIYDDDTITVSDIPQYEYLNNVNITNEPVTQTFLDTLDTGFGKIDMEALNKEVYSQLLIDGADTKLTSNIQINQTGKIRVTFKIVGHPGVVYKNTLYFNHKPLSAENSITFETALTRGNIFVIEADIDLEELDDLNTFYVVSVPSNAADFPKDVVTVMKTHSILLYK